MLPPPRASIVGATTRTVRTTLITSNSNAPRQATSSKPDAGPAGGPPEFVTSKSTPPNRSTVAACHPAIVSEWEESAHARSATNPLFLAVYEGKGAGGRPTGGPGYRVDFPHSTGNCAACHVPGLAVNAGYFRRWFGNFTVTQNTAVTAE